AISDPAIPLSFPQLIEPLRAALPRRVVRFRKENVQFYLGSMASSLLMLFKEGNVLVVVSPASPDAFSSALETESRLLADALDVLQESVFHNLLVHGLCHFIRVHLQPRTSCAGPETGRDVVTAKEVASLVPFMDGPIGHHGSYGSCGGLVVRREHPGCEE